jgi:hypothetical protein
MLWTLRGAYLGSAVVFWGSGTGVPIATVSLGGDETSRGKIMESGLY